MDENKTDEREGPLRHRQRHVRDETAFGSDRFGQWAERFARFFGTPKFIAGQTIVVALWIVANGFIIVHELHAKAFDPYPFILLNLLFSTQAAYAAPLILLAQTRQADRDKAGGEADAHHREEVAARQTALIEQNTAITTTTRANTEQIAEIHKHVAALTDHFGIEVDGFEVGPATQPEGPN
ncbi:MAG: DUF1003 domain-containing protein [Acidimicrobiales bacterium]